MFVALIHGAGDAPAGNIPLLSHSLALTAIPPCKHLPSPAGGWISAGGDLVLVAKPRAPRLSVCPSSLWHSQGCTRLHPTQPPDNFLTPRPHKWDFSAQPGINPKVFGQGQCRNVKEGLEGALEKVPGMDRCKHGSTRPSHVGLPRQITHPELCATTW